jgi:hypothetical protein
MLTKNISIKYCLLIKSIFLHRDKQFKKRDEKDFVLDKTSVLQALIIFI